MSLQTDADGLGTGDQDQSAEFWRTAFESLVDGLPEAAFVVDTDGVVTHWNDAVVQLHGMSADEAVGMKAYDVFETKGESETLAERVARTGEPVRESKIRSSDKSDGESSHARALAVPIT